MKKLIHLFLGLSLLVSNTLLAQISTISMNEAQDFFQHIKKNETFFRNRIPDICCYRSYRVGKYFHEKTSGDIIFGRISVLPKKKDSLIYFAQETGFFHTAPVINVMDKKGINLMVLEPRYFNHPVSVEQWLQTLFIIKSTRPYDRESIVEMKCDQYGSPPKIESLNKSIHLFYFIHDQSFLFPQRAVKEKNFSKPGLGWKTIDSFCSKGTDQKYNEIETLDKATQN